MAIPRDNSQLALDLPTHSTHAREDTIVTDVNGDVLEFLDYWPHWPTKLAILAGPVGSGKSHMARVWAQASEARFISFGDRLENEAQSANLIVEDLTPENLDATWLFHAINSTRASGRTILLTSCYWPSQWNVELNDLASRLKTAHVMELAEPDDALLTGVLFKLFTDRQLSVDQSVLDYLVVRMERSLASAARLVAEIDEASLAGKRPITRPLASMVLNDSEFE